MIRVVVILFLILSSCKNKKVEYFSNGNIHKEYYLKNDALVGDYLTYYNNGNIKSVDLYKNNIKVDSTVFYDSLINKKISKIIYWKNTDLDSFYVKNFQNGKISSEGIISDSMKLGTWKYYKNEVLEKKFQYKVISNKQYSNQGWVFNEKGDTLKSKSNYYKLIIPDKIKQNQNITIKIEYNPIISLESSLTFLCSKHYNHDFSNINLVKPDSIFGIKNVIEFKFRSKKSGKINLRGVLKEYANLIPEYSNGHTYKERLIYIDEPLFIE